MDEIRIWSTVRSQAQIQQVCISGCCHGFVMYLGVGGGGWSLLLARGVGGLFTHWVEEHASKGGGRVVTCWVEEHASKGVGRVVTCRVEEHASKGVGRVVTCRVEEHASKGVGRVVTCRVEEHASKGVGRVVTCRVEEHASKGVGRVVTCRVEEHSSKGVGDLLHVGQRSSLQCPRVLLLACHLHAFGVQAASPICLQTPLICWSNVTSAVNTVPTCLKSASTSTCLYTVTTSE